MSGIIKDDAALTDDSDEFDTANFTNEDDEKVKAEILAGFDDGSEEADDSWMSPEIEDTPLDLTSHTDGQKVIERAEDERRRARKTEDVDDAADGDDADKTAADDDKDAGKAADKAGDDDEDDPEADKKADDLASAALDTLLDGIPDDRKGEIGRRLKASEAALAPFQTPYVKAQMQKYGAEPAQVASRLVELAAFAETNPDEYLAWAASEMAATPDKIGEVLANAAKRHGYKLVKEGEEGDGDDDDDLFLDDATRAILEENKRLKAAQAALKGTEPEFGPDTPERRQARALQQALHDFTTETDEVGNLKRPFFDQLHPRIAQMAHEHRAQTSKPISVEDLARFYDAAVEEARASFGAAPNAPAAPSAAQGGNDLSNVMKKKAAAAEKARRASKSIGGAGQGAHRQPAQSGDEESTLDVVKKLAGNFGI